jgi:hypothetical protein
MNRRDKPLDRSLLAPTDYSESRLVSEYSVLSGWRYAYRGATERTWHRCSGAENWGIEVGDLKMGTGECKVAKQSGQKGYFGRVVLQAEPKGDGEISVEFDEKNATRWQSGVRFGIDLVLEHVPKRTVYPKGFRILVSSIEGHDVDTTSSLIAYITARAMFQALGVEQMNNQPSLDMDKGLVEFAN